MQPTQPPQQSSQPAPTPSQLPVTSSQQSQTLGIVSLILGILAFVSGFIVLFALPLGIAAIVTGTLGVKRPGKGMAIGGIVTGALGLLTSIAIVAMTFFALPSMQRNQRDTERKAEVHIILEQVSTYQSENAGALPTADELQARSIPTLRGISAVSSTDSPSTSTALYTPGTSCRGAASPRAASVSVKLESGDVYCQDS